MQVHFHPHRAQDRWNLTLSNGSKVLRQEKSSFGQVFTFHTLKKETTTLSFQNQDGKTLNYEIGSYQDNLWLYEASDQIFTEPPPSFPGANQLIVHVQNPGTDYSHWKLQVRDTVDGPWTNKTNGLLPYEIDAEGFSFVVPLPPSDSYSSIPRHYDSFPNEMAISLLKDEEESSSEIKVYPKYQGNLFFTQGDLTEIFCSPDFKPCPMPPRITGAAAHFLDSQHIKWNFYQGDVLHYELRYSLDASIELNPDTLELTGGKAIPIRKVPDLEDSKFPHLGDFHSYQLAQKLIPEELTSLAQSQVVVAARTSDGRTMKATHVQLAGFIDNHFTSQESLGLSIKYGRPTLRVWSPTAQAVSLKVYDQGKNLVAVQAMSRNDDGVWANEGSSEWLKNGYFYRYLVSTYHYASNKIENYEVIDPYSISLSRNSQYSHFTDVTDPKLKPDGWDELQKTAIPPADISIYEVHIRDFSIGDETVPPSKRGLYTAFNASEPLSLGMKHLRSLAESGLSHIQVLPAADFASVNEDRSQQINLDSPLEDLCHIRDIDPQLCDEYGFLPINELYKDRNKRSGDIQRLNKFIRDLDGFNWGYDPVVYSTPEGSYSSQPDGSQRILEFRQMVMELHKIGLRFSLDVVYNHSYASGLYPFSVLDKIVPGYYHRRNPVSGTVERSTCCENTASEHIMMEKLIIDSLQYWVEQFKVDAFRFDLMGHHSKSNMLAIKEALGDEIYLYGEGWDFGEVSLNQRGINASQLNMYGTGIGSFNDRFRDAIRGGSVFDCGYLLSQQGLSNGLALDPNEFGGLYEARIDQADCSKLEHWRALPEEDQLYGYQDLADRLRIGLAGSVRSFPLEDRWGTIKRADEISYSGQATAYAQTPQETINYISKHDGQTLWDINQLKLPLASKRSERLQAQKLGMALNLTAQGIPFFQLGADFLRSKSLNRDSFNSGDWFNLVDFSYKNSAWDRGLPREDKDGSNWELMLEVLDHVKKPSPSEAKAMNLYVKSLLELRYSSPLFRLSTTEDVVNRVRFHNTGPFQDNGIISMSIADSCHHGDIDPETEEILIFYNLSSEERDVAVSGLDYDIHPFSEGASINGGKIHVLPRDLVVVSKPQNSDCP